MQVLYPGQIGIWRVTLIFMKGGEPERTEEGLNGVNRQPSNGQKNNRQPSKNGFFLPSTVK